MPRSRRAGIVGAVVVAALLLSAAAYGWVSTRPATGAGRVVAGEPLQKLLVAGPTNFPLRLDEPVALEGTFVNDNTFTISVARVRVSVSGIGPGSGVCELQAGVNFFTTDAIPAAGGFFTVGGSSPVTGSGSGDWSGATIEFRSSPDFDQSGCLNRRISLKYTAVAG